MIAAMRVPVWSKRRCVQITAFGADDVPEVKISAQRDDTSGSSPASSPPPRASPARPNAP